MEAPTIERLRQSENWEAPATTQSVKRVAYCAIGRFEGMERAGRITKAQARAGAKFERHFLGAMGVRVGSGDALPDLDGEFPTVYHGQMVASARSAMLEPEFRALIHHVEESADLETIGRDWVGARNRPQAIAYGTALTITALERLALHWRLKEP